MKKIVFLLILPLLMYMYADDVKYEENYDFNEFEFEEQEGISEETIVDYQQNPINEDLSEYDIDDEDAPDYLNDSEEIYENSDDIQIAAEDTENSETEEDIEEETYSYKFMYKKSNYISGMKLLRNPRRIFEVGLKLNAGASNNYFAAKDIFVEDLVFDLPQMSEDVPDDGWQIDFCLNSEFYANLTLKNNWQFGIATGIESNGSVNVSKKLFDYLGKGFNLYETLSVGGDANGDVYYYTQAYTGFDVYGFHVKVTPAIVKPMIHLETKDVYGAYVNDKTGLIKVSANADVVLYGGIDLEPLLENDFSASSITAELFKNIGFDMELAVEHSFFDVLECGAYLRIPMVPGKLSHRADVLISYDYEVENIKALINGDYEDATYKDGEKTYSSADMNIHRPFKMGLEAAYRPFGNFFTANAMVGLGVKNPYSGDAKAYPEYNLGCEAIFAQIIGGWVSTGYLNQVFTHEAGIIMNFRVFEMDIGVSLQGANIEKSFKGSGVGAFVNLVFGF